MTDRSTPSQEDRDTLRAKNMEAFQQHHRSLAEKLARHVPASKLIFDGNGQPDVIFEGQKFYDGNHDAFIEEQIEAYKKSPYRFKLAPPEPRRFDTVGRKFLDKILSRAITEMNITFSANHKSMETFFVAMFGIGLGGQIDPIIEITNCKTIIFVDPNIESLYHSLEIYDWANLYEQQTQKRGLLHFLITTDSHDVFDGMKFYVRTGSVPAVDGMHVYRHYNHPLFTSAFEQIRQNGGLFLAGLGFVADEIKMIENTHKNLSTGKAHIYYQQASQFIKTPCFIVGCGPSLDQDIAYIKRNADNAIIFSSGSALGPLLNAGITPDFQIEVENEGILPVMHHVSELHDISDICLVTSTTIEPEIVDYFKNIIYHFRPALSPFGIFSNNEKNTIPYHDPSVINSSVGLAQDLGFREFYMFGCDMGTRDADLHHAKNSYHFRPDAQLPDNDFCIPVPANFGGGTHTSDGLFWVKSNIEKAIHVNREGRSYYNCSDGAFIDGTMPMFAKKIKLPPLEESHKAKFIADTVAHCPVMTLEEFDTHWRTDEIQTVIDDCMNEIKAITEYADFINEDAHLVDFNNLFFKVDSRIKMGVSVLVRGTMQMILLGAVFYTGRIRDKDKAIEFEDIVREEILNISDEIHESCTKLITDLRPD